MSPVAAATLQVLPGLVSSTNVSCLRRNCSSNSLGMLSSRSGGRPRCAGHDSGTSARCSILSKGLTLLIRASAGGGDGLGCGGRASYLRRRLSDLGDGRS